MSFQAGTIDGTYTARKSKAFKLLGDERNVTLGWSPYVDITDITMLFLNHSCQLLERLKSRH